MSPRRSRTRPARGTPAATRARLVAAAAAVFNRDGYHGTDSNRIARAAGYAPGTFYKHFTDKRAILLAAYEEWVSAEWAAIESAVTRRDSAPVLARRIVDQTLAWHRRWRGLRASVLALVGSDETVRRFYRSQRRRQLQLLRRLRAARHAPPRSTADDAVLLFALERTLDAVANGEVRDLGIGLTAIVKVVRNLVRQHIEPAEPTTKATSGAARR